jgi:hypothetical protein
MIILSIVAVMVVYYLSYKLLRNKKLSYVFAAIPAIILTGFIWWLIRQRYLTLLVFGLYAFGAIIVFNYAVLLIKRRRYVVSLMTAGPGILSFVFFLWYAKVNYFFTVDCNAIDGCMNESGLIMWFAFIFMIISFVITAFVYLIEDILPEKRKQLNS